MVGLIFTHSHIVVAVVVVVVVAVVVAVAVAASSCAVGREPSETFPHHTKPQERILKRRSAELRYLRLAPQHTPEHQLLRVQRYNVTTFEIA